MPQNLVQHYSMVLDFKIVVVKRPMKSKILEGWTMKLTKRNDLEKLKDAN